MLDETTELGEDDVGRDAGVKPLTRTAAPVERQDPGNSSEQDAEAIGLLSGSDSNGYDRGTEDLTMEDPGSNRSRCARIRGFLRVCLWGRCLQRGRSDDREDARSRPSSLACAPSTSVCLGMLLPLLCILNHVLFYYGQTLDMWRLVLTADVDVWYNATGYEARTAYYALGLETDTHVQYQTNRAVRSFTYRSAIEELYEAKGMSGPLLIPRTAALLLVLFSGVWPHLKLLLLSGTWLLAKGSSTRRHRTLQWLSTLGKWSLADVLVVCVMVGVLNLDWHVDPTAIKNGFVYQVPLLIDIVQHMYSVTDVCTYLLHLDCASPPSTWARAKCASCRNFVDFEFQHPKTTRTSFAGIAKGVQESGSGYVRLRVEGMSGIYYFCVAVVLSILLSLLVDVVDVRVQRRERIAAAQENMFRYMRLSSGMSRDEADEEQPNGAVGRGNGDAGGSHNRQSHTASAFPQSMAADDSYYEMLRPSGSLSTDSFHVRFSLYILSAITSLLVFWGSFANILERKVTGAIPQLMHDILGIAWDRPFSLQSLVAVTGAAGGWDWLLMATFALFVLIGPLLRAILCLMALVLPWDGQSSSRLQLHTAIDFIGAFCAWEVVALACYLVSLLMPMATSTIIMKQECAKVDESGSCLEVSFDLLQNRFWLVLVGGASLVFTARCCHWILPHR